MKINNILIVAATLLLFGCPKPIKDPDATFTAPTQVNIGEAVTYNLTNPTVNQMAIIYPGEDGFAVNSFGPDGKPDKGLTTSKGTASYAYQTPGTYTITSIARNYGNDGEDYTEDVKTATIFVVDRRNEISKKNSKFLFNVKNGVTKIVNDSTIRVEVAGPLYNINDLYPIFTLVSDTSKLYMYHNNVETYIGTNKNHDTTVVIPYDSINPIAITYIVKPFYGASKNYYVSLVRTIASSENKVISLDKFGGSFGVPTIIDTINHTATITIPWGATRFVPAFTVSEYAGIYATATATAKPYTLTRPVDFTTAKTFYVKSQIGIFQAWSFIALPEPFPKGLTFKNLIPAVSSYQITDDSIFIKVIQGTDLTNITPAFEGIYGIAVWKIVDSKGVAHDFSKIAFKSGTVPIDFSVITTPVAVTFKGVNLQERIKYIKVTILSK